MEKIHEMKPKKYEIKSVHKVMANGLCYGEFNDKEYAEKRIEDLTAMQTITLKDGTTKEVPAKDYDAGYVSRCCGERMYMIFDTKRMYCVKCGKWEEYVPKW